MPSANLCAPSPPLVCHLRPVRTAQDAEVFIATRTKDNHRLGSDTEKVLQLLTAKGRMAFVVEDGVGHLLGSASITEGEVAIGVVGVSILEAFRGRGYGKLILRQLERIAVEFGFIALRADIFEDCDASVALFSHAGYRRYALFEKPL